ncbi:Hypothetical predicted protein [Mytilus galloprovincialis]|uniref:Acyltransferase 3 domain-containing protein n=2 Tax=Mytilus galloprovincialis TaxID=29158 RepID=A0A8B6H1Y5_MYTGA|nr:Hypothetical predicted protein [Mytilus galloprovincialis]
MKRLGFRCGFTVRRTAMKEIQVLDVGFSVRRTAMKEIQVLDVGFTVKRKAMKEIKGNPTVTIGVCVPDSCSKKDVQNLLRKFLYENVSTELTASIQTCVETDIPYDTRAEIVLVVIGLFIAAMLLGTGYDLIVIQWPKWRRIEEITSSEEIAIEASEKQQLIENTKSRIKEYQPGIPGKLLLSFSMYTNGSKILDTKQGKGVITCINGIRFLSMTWVIIGHAFSAPNNIADNIAEFMPRMLKRWTFMAVCNAYVSVDSFFTLSGLLLTYLVMKELDKNKGRLKWFMFYFHRFWRLTPPYMLVIMVSVSLFHYTGTGPNWPTGGIDKGCEKGWWYNLLYINNFVEDNKKKCFGVAWYLANDMQFYILSPLILLPLYHFHLLGVGILMVFLVGTTITTGVISTHYDIPANNFDAGDATHWKKLYVKPYCRIGPYLVGMYAGYILYRTNCKVRINRYLNLAIWSAAIGTGMAIVYGLYDDINSETPLPTSVAAFYNAVHRTAWGLCISWVIFACATGNGGFINTILSWKAFIPLSRLTYMAYLVHMMILNHWKYSQTKTIHLSDSEYIYEIVGHIVLSFMAAFVTSLAFESPMLGLESVIFRRKQNKR